ncbi:MAG: hypothetical protein QOE45_1124 [Frankiaceae bacterium]|jgi:hypothetical protein|nr:hypothetical protein [Frankiaceae bacterium]
MRLRHLALVSGPLAIVLGTASVPVPAYAAGEFPITVNPDAAHPHDTTTVTGDATGPTCANDGIAVTLHYTAPSGTLNNVTVNTTTDANGHFSAVLTVPDNAVAGEEASVTALIADCTPPSAPTISRSSESVPFDVLAYSGAFTANKSVGRPGDKVHFSGTNCWGGTVDVSFGPIHDIKATLLPDKTFSGDYTLPDISGGTYDFGASCPGTDYAARRFVLINPAAPATPVPGQPSFTG